MEVLIIDLSRRLNCLSEIQKEFKTDQMDIHMSFSLDIKKGLQLFKTQDFDLIIVNTRMEEANLLKLLTSIRQMKSTSIVIATDALEEDTAISLYEFGADICIAPFFRPRVAVAFLEAYYRRHFLYPNMESIKDREGIKNSAKKMFHGNLVIDPKARSVTYSGREIVLSTTEFDILNYLASNLNTALSHKQIYEQVWKTSYEQDFDLSVYMSRLRKKIFLDAKNTAYIKTVRGFGYMFSAK